MARRKNGRRFETLTTEQLRKWADVLGTRPDDLVKGTRMVKVRVARLHDEIRAEIARREAEG